MRLLLDTNVVVALLEEETELLPRRLQAALGKSANALHASVASLWEIAIKTRLNKLPLRAPVSQIPEALSRSNVRLLTIEASHVLALVDPEPPTRDPFDRLLLAQCHVENLRLVTRDRALEHHPLAWQP